MEQEEKNVKDLTVKFVYDQAKRRFDELPVQKIPANVYADILGVNQFRVYMFCKKKGIKFPAFPVDVFEAFVDNGYSIKANFKELS